MKHTTSGVAVQSHMTFTKMVLRNKSYTRTLGVRGIDALFVFFGFFSTSLPACIFTWHCDQATTVRSSVRGSLDGLWRPSSTTLGRSVFCRLLSCCLCWVRGVFGKYVLGQYVLLTLSKLCSEANR
ncbi:hypothetical protein AUEXF2481DRAFT_207744 [Aureobasidium subglaciale EXF-2481]|uniref:Transmembrane protein n=1 Tax=Aureobasidium subglaciale (strain EXF-2481) TaxID=1043005 RepID=A0A074YV20_AURSE|nr:uncharacterized protein AUEXF2481DRAFT_207744 [Aureobasidium subglaciale EXF-2481]KER00010.1 hypothetical protein AUEXF2481DRAFT_207744 [Aureobasidium subglaciale EXF-2481]